MKAKEKMANRIDSLCNKASDFLLKASALAEELEDYYTAGQLHILGHASANVEAACEDGCVHTEEYKMKLHDPER